MPVYRYLDTSTGCLTMEEMGNFAHGEFPLPLNVVAHRGGWFVQVPDDLDVLSKSAWPGLIEALRLARSKQCYWLNLDRDAAQDERLDTHEW